ncbi:MAG TPA: PP2C family protein-serine/threonine phosphatase [Thermoanaerobaculia bacterium]|nr:PP2C family protein-serine/threonine phosphatase [Thermoanaerobaculia bacterium]
MTTLEVVRDELLERRERLAGLAVTVRESQLVELLQHVDRALERLDGGTWGQCAVCLGTVEPDRLAADPLLTLCLDCLSPAERKALERDLETAARVQAALLPPRQLAYAGWEVALLWEPLGPVSGDHYDLLRPKGDDEPLHLVVGDASGKGVAASLVQSHLHALLRALAAPEISLAALLARANRLLCEVTLPAAYATLLAARLYPGGRVELANAGHPRPLLADRRGVRPVEGAGLPLGLFCEAEYTPRDLQLATGDTLLFYTDGWTEAATDEGEYGIGRAAAALRRGKNRPLSELLAACRADMEGFLHGAPRGDDLTLLALRRARPG